MSRVGKKPIPIPSGVKINIQGNSVMVEGPKGKLSTAVPSGIKLEQKDGHLHAVRESEEKAALHGLTRALVANNVEGVTKGWSKELEIVGIGYRAELKGKNTVVFTLGFSHPIEYPLPSGIDVAIDPKQTRLTVNGIDRQKVGQVAAEMRSLRTPDPYKQKGVRYVGEKLKKKVGKTGAK
jgi:large subunit ribosomal protein L6